MEQTHANQHANQSAPDPKPDPESSGAGIARVAKHYRGRFAPSPTGPLHFGSLVAAAGSFLQARRNNGQWLLRIDDLDLPRNQVGAVDMILRDLENFGFEWDGPVVYQQECIDSYQAALDKLQDAGLCYRCVCSRKTVRLATQNSASRVYPGTCRNLNRTDPDAAVRILTHAATVQFNDSVQGRFSQDIAREVGDFVIKRADNVFAYQLAVVVDDFQQGITEVVRGADLLDNTPRQMYLQHCLDYPAPGYMHLPVALNDQGQKLSKQTGAQAIDSSDIAATLYRVLVFLGQNPPTTLRFETRDNIWQWAIAQWRSGNVPRSNPDATLS